MEDLEIELAFDSAVSADMKSGDNAFILYFNVKNNLSKQIKVELPNATYLTVYGEEIEQDFWLAGLLDGALGATIRSGAYKRAGVVIDQRKLQNISTGDRIFVTLNVAKLSLRTSYEFICLDGLQKQFWLCEATKAKIEYDSNAQVGDFVALGKQEITNTIERLELLEEKFGITISGLYATCELQTNRTPPELRVEINFDVTSLTSGKLDLNCKFSANAYNAAGQLLATVPKYITSDFMGFDSISISVDLDQAPAKIRLFPSAL